jgi:hypothetical protein
LNLAPIDARRNPVSVEFDLVNPLSARRGFFDELAKLRLDPARRCGDFPRLT